MRPAWIVLGSVTLIAAIAALLLALVPWAPTTRAPMGATIVVEVRGDGSEMLYTTSPNWTTLDCDARTSSGQEAQLRPDMLSLPLPGSPRWEPRGALIESGTVTIRCDDARGGEFGVGATRGPGYLLLIVLLAVLAALTAIAALVLGLLDLRRSARAKPRLS